MRKLLIHIGIYLTLALGLMGCSVHHVDIQQGNIIEKQVLDKLKQGMSKKQVMFLLGTPLLRDPFQSNRWDYIYTHKIGNQDKAEKKTLTLYFKKDTLHKFENKGYPN